MAEGEDLRGTEVATMAHAEYKVPHGKLVVADLEICKGVITKIQLSGDFFMEPPEALEEINQALSGIATSVSTEEIESIVTKVVEARVSMYGITPNGVATVIKRALA